MFQPGEKVKYVDATFFWSPFNDDFWISKKKEALQIEMTRKDKDIHNPMSSPFEFEPEPQHTYNL